ncbi:MAG: hypothetical protein ACRDQ5_01090 [Sciscionella sp.]
MNHEEKNLLIGMVAGAIVVPSILGLAVGGPLWVWGGLVVILLVLVVFAGAWLRERQHRVRSRSTVVQRQHVPTDVEPYQEVLPTVSLDSADPDYRFHFSATVLWRRAATAIGPPHADPRDLAINSVIDRAREVTRTVRPEDHSRLGHRLGAALGSMAPDPSHYVVASAREVALTVPEEDAGRLARQAELRKDERYWEHQRNHERNMRAYLADDVLSSTSSAVVWWLANHTDQVEENVRLIDSLARLVEVTNSDDAQGSSRSNGQRPSTGHPDHAEGLLNQLCPDPADPRRAALAHRLAELAGNAGAEELATRLGKDVGAAPTRRSLESAPVEDSAPEVGGVEVPRQNRVERSWATQPHDGPAAPVQPTGPQPTPGGTAARR